MSGRTLEAVAVRGCPKCGTPLRVGSVRPSIDEPLEQCAACGSVVVRQGVNEWDLLKPGQKAGHLARHAVGALIVGMALALVPLTAVLGTGRSWGPGDALLWLAGGWILAGIWESSRLAARIRRSRRRMGDPMYLAKLVEYEIAATSRR